SEHALITSLTRQPRTLRSSLFPYTTLFRSTDLFIRRPVLAAVISLLILVLGLRSLAGLSVNEYPQTQNAVVTVSTTYYGILCLRSEEHTSELQSRGQLVCSLLIAKKRAAIT